MKNWIPVFAISCISLYSCTKANSDGTHSTIQLIITSISPVHGPSGTEDTLTGKGFSDLPDLDSVFLNGKRLTIVSKTDDRMIVDIPPLAGTGKITIHTNDGVIMGPVFKYDPSLIVTTLAGSGTAGSADGAGSAACFHNPTGIAVDKAGNVFVADSYNSSIRKITPSGVVTIFAGSVTGEEGSIDGTGTMARFAQPMGLAIDTKGYLYVADAFSFRIRKISPSGVVTTLAGDGNFGMVDGPGVTASFGEPYGVAVDINGNVFVADQQNNEIRKITPDGVVSSIAGGGYHQPGWVDGVGAAARFNTPWGIAVSNTGNIYVGDLDNHMIREITSGNVVTTLAGTTEPGFTNGQGTKAAFWSPSGLAVDLAENIYVADGVNNAIRKIDLGGNVTTYVGGGTGAEDGPAPYASFRGPYAVAIDSIGNLYITDELNNKIRKVTIQ